MVSAYRDDPIGVMDENPDGSGQFTSITLRPTVEVGDPSMVEAAELLHGEVDRWCFIARSLNFPVRHQPRISVQVHR